LRRQGRGRGRRRHGARGILGDLGGEAHAEQALKGNYGLGRTLYEGMSGPLGVDTVYLEVTPQ